MTRAEAIAIINTKLASFDDERVLAMADNMQTLDIPSPVPRKLSDRELNLLEQSRRDFEEGRTLTLDELIDELDTALAPLGVHKYRA